MKQTQKVKHNVICYKGSDSNGDNEDSNVDSSDSEEDFDVANLVQTTHSGRKIWSWHECSFKFFLKAHNSICYFNTMDEII